MTGWLERYISRQARRREDDKTQIWIINKNIKQKRDIRQKPTFWVT